MNNQRLKGHFFWQDSLLKRLAALLYAQADRVIDPAAIRACLELIKGNTSVFSTFRGNSAMSIATLLSLQNDRERLLQDTLSVYAKMKENKFHASDFLVVAAYQIAAQSRNETQTQAIKRAKAFYDGMKSRHYFLTGQSDIIFATMLGLSDLDLAIGLDRMEQLYRLFKPEFHSGNGVQALTQVIALGGENHSIESRVLALCDRFRNRSIRLDKEYTLSSLGVLALLSAPVDTLVDDVTETYALLRTKKGFGSWSMTKQEVLLFAASLVAVDYVDAAGSGVLTTAITTSLTNIIIAQQAAMTAAIVSSSAASASAS